MNGSIGLYFDRKANFQGVVRFGVIFMACFGLIIEGELLFEQANPTPFEVFSFQFLIFLLGVYFLYYQLLIKKRYTVLQDLEKKIDYFEAFQKVMIKVAAEPCLKNQLKLICEALARLMKTSRVSIMLKKGEYLEIIESIGLSDEIKNKTKMKPGDGIAGWVFENETPLILKGNQSRYRFKNFIPKETPIYSSLCVPFKYQNQVLGVMNFSHCDKEKFFDQNDLDIVTFFANEVSMALQKETLISQLATHVEKLKSTELELVQAEKMSDLGLLVSGLSHEIKNFLSPLKGHLQLIPEYFNNPKKIHQSVQTMEKVVDRMSSLVDEILGLSRKKEQKLEPTCLNKLIEDMLELFKIRLKGTHIELQVQLESDLQPIFADSGLLKQVLLNLLNNALQSFENTEGIISVCTYQENGKVVLAIKDSGKGMSSEIQKKLFEPFFTTKEEKGTGLGLNICKKIMEAHHGEIKIFSKPGEGTSMQLLFPKIVPRGTI